MEHRGAVVVGLGTMLHGAAELDWAAREAQLRGRELHVIHAFDPVAAIRPWDHAIDPAVVADVRHVAERRIQDAVVHVRRLWPELLVWGTVVDGVAQDVLCEASVGAEVTVLGSRRLTSVNPRVPGSVTTAVTAGASGPVVVVGSPPDATTEIADVVVGVDGSEQTDSVLSFAFDYASRHHRGLHAIFCWSPDGLAIMHWGAEPHTPGNAARWLAEAVAGWRDKYPDVVVRRGVVRAFPVAGLLAASAGQELLVVGSGPKHTRLRALLGSVSQSVLHQAACSVAVIHTRSH